jgi:hypothetical protein
MTTKIYRLPKKFADDHWDRDCGETDRTVRETKAHYYVEMDMEGYRDMLSDADYYRDFDRYEGFEWAPLASSARATYAALKKAGAPGADEPVTN